MRPRIRFAGILLTVILPCSVCVGDSDSPGSYRLHVAGSYYIRGHGDPLLVKAEKEGYDYAESVGFIETQSGDITSYSLATIRDFAVVAGLIVGRAEEGFYICVMNEQTLESHEEDFTLYPNEAQWLDAMRKLGVTKPPELQDPKKVAATRPDIEVRPWDYRMTGGFWGLSDMDLSGIIMFGMLPLGFFIGMLTKPPSLGIATAVGLLTAFVGIGFGAIWGDVGGALCGTFFLPFFAAGCVALGARLRAKMCRVNHSRHHPQLTQPVVGCDTDASGRSD
jgi:hypothetical protein